MPAIVATTQRGILPDCNIAFNLLNCFESRQFKPSWLNRPPEKISSRVNKQSYVLYIREKRLSSNINQKMVKPNYAWCWCENGELIEEIARKQNTEHKDKQQP